MAHEYRVSVQWSGGRDGSGTINLTQGRQSIDLGVPAEFQGSGKGTNPEELLTSAVAACYSMTFGIIAANRKLAVQSFTCEAVGEVVQSGAQFTYTKITIRPNITLEPGADHALAEDMAHKADSYCIITNAVRGKVEIVVEPTIT
jgi:peroxiredoxin-like protein